MKKIFILLSGLLTLASCVEKMQDDLIRFNTPTDWGLQMLQADSEGLSFESVEKQSDCFTITLSSDTRITVPYDEVLYDDCSSGSSPKETYSDGVHWYVGSIAAALDVTLPDEESVPFYIYNTADDLHAFYSNGREIIFRAASPSEQESETGLAEIRLYTDSEVTSRETYVRGYFEYGNDICDSIQIRGRGNTSWNIPPKKSYKIKLDSKSALFASYKNRDWDLIANYSDKTLLRNILAMEISRRLGFDWTPEMQSVEVWMNGEYEGIYTLSEHKEVANHKVVVDIDGGGVYLELDKLLDEPTHFNTGMKIPVNFKDPENPSPELLSATKQFFADFEEGLIEGANNYSDYIDVPSFINYFIVNEFSKNIDGKLNKSTFITREAASKMRICHIWDYDIAFGNCNYFQDYYPLLDSSPYGFVVKDYTHNGLNTGWFHYLFLDPQFVSEVKERWREVKPLLETLPQYIAGQAELLGDAVDRNFERWPILGTYVWPNMKYNGKYPETYEKETEYLLWFMSERLSWMNAAIESL